MNRDREPCPKTWNVRRGEWVSTCELEKEIAELKEDREVQARINTEAISKLMLALSDCRKEQLKP